MLSIEESTEIMRALPTNRIASCDNITYEHINYGGEALLKTLLVLFNSIIEHETLPDGFKTGLTITLHKVDMTCTYATLTHVPLSITCGRLD